MKYSLEKLDAEAAADRSAAEILIEARETLEKGTGTAEADIIKAVKEVFILRGAKVAAQWAFDSIPAFAADNKEAAERVKRIIEQESGEAALDALCNYYRENKGARQRRRHDIDFLTAEAERLERAAELIKEGQQIRQERGLQEPGEDAIIKAVKECYINLQSIEKAAQWAFDSVPGFSLTVNKAKERVIWIIDAEESGEAALDKACSMARDRNRKRAAIWT